MLALISALRFTARSQTSPEGRGSASLRSTASGAFWPENTATRRHFRLAPVPWHCWNEPLSDEFLAGFAAGAFAEVPFAGVTFAGVTFAGAVTFVGAGPATAAPPAATSSI